MNKRQPKKKQRSQTGKPSTSIETAIAADDTGADTLARFEYQAKIALPFCIECLVTDDVTCIIMEHLEDFAVRLATGKWRLIQVKTKNPELGPWGLAEVLSPSGALHSLYRTFNTVGHLDVSLEMVLEGAPRARDPILEFLTGNYSPETKTRLQQALSANPTEIDAFLSKVVLLASPPSRTDIDPRNRDIIHQVNGNLNRPTVIKTEKALRDEIRRAMRAESVGTDWPLCLWAQPTDTRHTALSAKTLTKEALRLVAPALIGGYSALLQRSTAADGLPVSNLERKLRNGLASDKIVLDARMLRAETQKFTIERQASGVVFDKAGHTDLEIRLETQARAREAAQRNNPFPANAIWNALLDDVNQLAATFDRHLVFNADPMLLLGTICQSADECRITFGNPK